MRKRNENKIKHFHTSLKRINKYKMLTICIIALLLANICGILAYLTDKDSKTNSLTIEDCYTIVFHSNYGTDQIEIQNVFYNQTTNLRKNTFEKENSSFLKWTTNPDGTGNSYTDEEEVTNLTTRDVKNIDLYATWVDGVAEINGTIYNTLQEAINAVPNTNTETTIKLLRNINENVSIVANKNIILNLQNHTITNNTNTTVIKNYGTLKIRNGTVTSNAGSAVIDNESTGKLVVSDHCNLIATGIRQAIYNNKGNVEILEDSYLSSTSTERATVQNVSGGTLTITGGTIVSTGRNAIENNGNMTIGIKDGNIDKSTPVFQGVTYGISSSTNYSFYNGIVKGKNAAFNNESRITDKEDGYSISHQTETINEENYDTAFLGMPCTITFNAHGGKINEHTRIVEKGDEIGTLPVTTKTGCEFVGWFTDEIDGEEITSQTIVSNDVTYHAHWITTAVAEIDGTIYYSIQDAINTVPRNNTQTTIKILRDVDENLKVAKNQNIKFNLQNYTISCNDNLALIENDGTVEIYNGTLTSNQDTSLINNNNTGKLTVSGGNIISTGTRQVIYNKGFVEITGNAYLSSTTSGTPTASDVHLERGTVQNLAIGTILITGGTIEAPNQHAVSNEGTLIIGEKDGNINITTPILKGHAYGILNTGTVSFYDGIVKGDEISGACNTTITEIENNSEIEHSLETIGTDVFDTMYLVSL